MKKIFGLLLLLPLLSLVLVPVATVSATHGFDVEIEAECSTTSYTGSASVSYAGHSVSTTCTTSDEDSASACFNVYATTKFTASTTIGGISNTLTGKMGPKFAPEGYFEFYSFAPDIVSYAYVYVGYC